MSDRKASKPAPTTPATIRRKNMALNRRNSQAAAADARDAVIRKVRSAKARDDETITLWLSEAELLVHFCTTSRRGPGAPVVMSEFLRWMARDVCLRRDGGAKAKVAISEVAEAWQVKGAMVAKVVREYGADARGWLDKHGADRDSTAVLVAQRAEAYRMLAIERERKEETPAQRARRDQERTSGGRMAANADDLPMLDADGFVIRRG